MDDALQSMSLPGKRLALILLSVLVAAAAGLAVLLLRGGGETALPPPATSFSALLTRIGDGRVQRLTLDPHRLAVRVDERAPQVRDYEIGVPGDAGTAKLVAAAGRARVELRSKPAGGGRSALAGKALTMIPGLLLVLVLALVAYRQMRPGGTHSRHRRSTTDVGFEQVAGVGEAVQELADVREFLADPKRFEALGAKVPKGVLLHGPPGTGKTMLAKAIAAEADADFYAVSGSDFVQMFVGLGAMRVRTLFRQAKRRNRPAIIFIDELDAVGQTRSSGGGDGAQREGDQTLTQLLTEMDGFQASEHPVVVIAASNHMDKLDPALLRPGRFDRLVAVDPPDRHGRRAIIGVHAQGKALTPGIDLDGLAEHTAGMTGAELANILNETVLEAARRHADTATDEDLENAFFRVVAGAKKQHRAMSDHERRVTAYHEAGHALAGELLAAADKVHKISIIPRGRSGGQTLLVSEEDVFLHSRQGLRDRLVWTLAGRAAEQLVFDEVTTGAGDDLQRATSLAWKMVAQLGMGDALGLRVADQAHPLSPALSADADAETRALLAAQYERALRLLSEHRVLLERVAQALLAEEVLDRPRFLSLLGPVEDPAALPADPELTPADGD
jgi:cell division protease FtsH